MEAVPSRLHVRALHLRLCGRIAELERPLVADVVRAFLEVSSVESEPALWSLAFVFDEDDGRVARLEARFWDPGVPGPPAEELPGYEVQLVLPRVFPLRTPAERMAAAEKVLSAETTSLGVVARFVRALTDLGAYRAVEPQHVVSAEAHLL